MTTQIKQKLIRLWAEKRSHKGYRETYYNYINAEYKHTPIFEITLIMLKDGVSEEEIERVIND